MDASSAHRRLNILNAHLSATASEPQAASDGLEFQKTAGSSSAESILATLISPTDASSHLSILNEQNQQILRDKYVWDNNHVSLRHEILSFFEQHKDAFTMKHDTEHATMNGAIPWAHDRTVEIFKQGWIDPKHLREDPLRVFAWQGSLVVAGEVSTKCSIHITLYEAMIALLGTERHEQFLTGEARGENIGFFAMSEVGHASNLKRLGTTATYDPSTQTFVLNTPDPLAQKCWIGNSFYSSKTGVVFAHLIVNGKNYGLHCFVVPIRDVVKGFEKPGVATKLVGLKAGLHGLDNGRLMFKDFRIPREMLLNKYADVTAKGDYVTKVQNPNLLFAKHIGALLSARLGVGLSSTIHAQLGVTIATRYAFVRKQFAADTKGEELPLIFYQSHRNALMPLLAQTYAATYFQNYCLQRYAAAANKDDEKALKEVHLLASTAKAGISWFSLDLLQKCREMCGGQGYLARNLIANYKIAQDVWCTLDGANNLLYQQIAQVLLANGVKTEKFKELSSLVNSQKTNTNQVHLRSRQFLLSALAYRQDSLLIALGKKLKEEIRSAAAAGAGSNAEFLAFNDRCQTDALKLAQAYCDNAMAEAFNSLVSKMEQQLGNEHPISVANRAMFQLYVLSKLTSGDGATFLLESGAVNGEKLEAMRDQVDALCRALAPVSRSLCDAFGNPEYLFDYTIASKKFTLSELVDFNNKDLHIY